MEAPGTAIEQFLNEFIRMRLLMQVVLSDRQGNTILACFGPATGGSPTDSNANAPDSRTEGDEEVPMESNVVLSGARCFQSMDQLHLGQPQYISAQYHDAVVVQTVDPSCLLTLIGSRSHGHCVGGLLALLPQIRQAPVYKEIVEKVDECYR